MKTKLNNSFNEQCYNILRTVPIGYVTTYGDIAHALGTKAYRAVGNAMNKNPYSKDDVPCHRVVKSNGNIGGYAHEIKIKKELLITEGIFFDSDNNIIDFVKKLYVFK
jgi:methylated-DNA-[protein]-cysteine S-methyltransferase